MGILDRLLMRRDRRRATGSDSDAFYRALAENIPDPIMQVTPDGKVLYVSAAFEELFGVTLADVARDGPLAPVLPEDRPIIGTAVARFAAGEIGEIRTQVRAYRADGAIIWIETTMKESDSSSAVLVLRDITERKLLEEQLARFAMQDGLTGLGNRRAFDEALDQAWRSTVSRRGELALLLIDVDFFKQFNDQYGHQAGDDCLRSIAASLQQSLGGSAYRYGGEEVAVILEGEQAVAAPKIAEQARQAIASLRIPHDASACSGFVTVSIGLATAVARDGGTMRMPEGLLQAADHALYRAKREGRDRVVRSLLIAPGSGAAEARGWDAASG